MAPRLYLVGDFAPGRQIALPPERSHYLASVLRAQPGMEVRLFNAAAGEWRAAVHTAAKKSVTLELQEQLRAPLAEPMRCLLFAPIRRGNLEWLIEKATELGATQLQPVITEHTQARTVNIERLLAIATEAAEQCERLSVPDLLPPRELLQLLAGWNEATPLHAALERSDAAPLSGMTDVKHILIGPEGGFSAAEREQLLRQAFVQPMSLGPRILRAETAALAALTHLALQD